MNNLKTAGNVILPNAVNKNFINVIRACSLKLNVHK